MKAPARIAVGASFDVTRGASLDATLDDAGRQRDAGVDAGRSASTPQARGEELATGGAPGRAVGRAPAALDGSVLRLAGVSATEGSLAAGRTAVRLVAASATRLVAASATRLVAVSAATAARLIVGSATAARSIMGSATAARLVVVPVSRMGSGWRLGGVTLDAVSLELARRG